MSSFFFKKWKQTINWIKKTLDQVVQESLPKKNIQYMEHRVLCVDDDSSFCNFIQRLAFTISIRIDLATSIESAKQAIEDYPDYHAYIIDGHLPDGSGFELVAWIRGKEKTRTPIGFLSRIYQDAKSFRHLKEILNVDYVLDKPIQPEDVHQLLANLCHLDKDSFCLFTNDFLEELKKDYQKTVGNKVEQLEKMILAVEKDPSLENLQKLKGEVHKIAGSAGSYGYMAVSELCKNLEIELYNQIDLAKSGLMNYQWLLSLDDFFTQIKLHFQLRLSGKDREVPYRISQSPSIYIVDKDELILKELAQFAKEHSFELLSESKPEKAIHTVFSEDFYPQIFLLETHYQASVITGYDILKAYYKKDAYLATITAFMIKKAAWGEMIEALKKGITCLIEKPFKPSIIFPLLDQTPFRAFLLHFKILVIDNDIDTSEYILKTLKYAGLEAMALQVGVEIEKQVTSYQPDLILLDINLTDQSGIKIIENLRKKIGYKKLLVGILAITPDDRYSIQNYFEAEVDDIIFKPIERSFLQRKVASLLRKQVHEILAAAQDSMMGLESIQTIKKYIDELQRQAQPPFPKILVIFEVCFFITFEQAVKKKVLSEISQFLENLFNKYEMVAYIGQGQFALVFQGFDPNFIQLFMHSFFINLHERLSKIIKKNVRLKEALSILIAGEKADDLFQRTELLLQLAEHKTDFPVSMIMEPTFIPLKEVYIYHDEGEKLENLNLTFKKQGFKVSSFTDIQEGHFHFLNPMPLLILIGSFAENKGLTLLKKWTMENQIQIPILSLSHCPKEENLEGLLKEVNYFKAPFSLIILIDLLHN